MTLQDNAILMAEAAEGIRLRGPCSTVVLDPGSNFKAWLDESKEGASAKVRRVKEGVTSAPASIVKVLGAAMALCLMLTVGHMCRTGKIPVSQSHIILAKEIRSMLLSSAEQQNSLVEACKINYNRADTKVQCGSTCAASRHIMPKPQTHKACLAGCEWGARQAWERGCISHLYDDVAACTRSLAGKQCQKEGCLPFQNHVPKPSIFNHCSKGCNAILSAGCEAGSQWAKEYLQRIEAGSDEL